MSNNIYDLWKNKDGKITNELGVVDNQNNKIINLEDPTDFQDAVNYRTLKKEATGVFIQTTSTPGKDISAKIPGNLDMRNQQIYNMSGGTFDTNAVNYKQLQATNTNVTTNTKVGLLNSKNIRTNKAEITSLEQRTTSSFFSQISGSKVYQIKNVNADSQSGLEFIYQPNNFTLFLRKQVPPTETIDLFSKNTTGFYNIELNSKLNLTLKSYDFIWTFEAHNTNNEDFIHIWPNTQTITYNANQQTIQQKGGSFIILNINGVYRIKKESATNKTKRLVQMHFFNNDGKYQILFLTNEGAIIWLADLLIHKQIRIAQHELIIKEIK